MKQKNTKKKLKIRKQLKIKHQLKKFAKMKNNLSSNKLSQINVDSTEFELLDKQLKIVEIISKISLSNTNVDDLIDETAEYR